jgi:hypothetical protein
MGENVLKLFNGENIMQTFKETDDVNLIEIHFHSPQMIDRLIMTGPSKLWNMDMSYVAMYNAKGHLVYLSDVGMERSEDVIDSLAEDTFSMRCM